MKRKRGSNSNGGELLQEAVAQLIQAQATLVQNQATLLQRLTNIEEVNKQRFARIEAILLRHEKILQGPPEAIREKSDSSTPRSELHAGSHRLGRNEPAVAARIEAGLAKERIA